MCVEFDVEFECEKGDDGEEDAIGLEGFVLGDIIDGYLSLFNDV